MPRYTIRELRRMRAWRQRDLAKEIGVSRLTVHKWETGAAVPYDRNRKKLAELFKVKMSEIIIPAEE